MAFLDTTFNVEELPISEVGNFEPLPEGWYTATICGAEIKTTKTGSGQYINVRYDITGPTHQGRVVWGMINIKNQSTKTEEIGRAQLRELMSAINLASLSDTDQLIGRATQIKLKVKPADGKYEAGNEVRGFKSAGGTAAPAAMPAMAAPAPAAASAPPWARK